MSYIIRFILSTILFYEEVYNTEVSYLILVLFNSLAIYLNSYTLSNQIRIIRVPTSLSIKRFYSRIRLPILPLVFVFRVKPYKYCEKSLTRSIQQVFLFVARMLGMPLISIKTLPSFQRARIGSNKSLLKRPFLRVQALQSQLCLSINSTLSAQLITKQTSSRFQCLRRQYYICKGYFFGAVCLVKKEVVILKFNRIN